MIAGTDKNTIVSLGTSEELKKKREWIKRIERYDQKINVTLT